MGVIYIRAVERSASAVPFISRGGGGRRRLLLFLRLRDFVGSGATNAFLASPSPSHVFN